MRSNYKRLGEYISPVEGRNKELLDIPLMGLSINKVFIPSIANTIGTDMSTYRVIKRTQFGYGPVTSRNGDKITIALFDDYDEALISQAYTPFEVTDTKKLLPEYLMMWFRRPEFDRYARFMSHGSAREIFGWEEMCNTLLPIPSPEKQREMVAEYNVVQNRIELNNQLIAKLEETAQAIYKQWFVDFEFPDENGFSYKSNGGEMVDSELGEIPKGWRINGLHDIIQFKNGKSKPLELGKYPVYGGNGIVEFVNDYNDENVVVIGRVGAYCGSLYRVLEKCWISDNAISAQSKINANMYSYCVLNGLSLNERSEGTGQPLITQGLLNSIRVINPNINVIRLFENIAEVIYSDQNVKIQESKKLTELKDLLLSKMTKVKSDLIGK